MAEKIIKIQINMLRWYVITYRTLNQKNNKQLLLFEKHNLRAERTLMATSFFNFLV